jgi:hypothetical protein
MNFFKKLFSKSEPFIPTPTQTIPGLDPIVVHAVENLYSNIEDQQHAFTYLLNKAKGIDTLTLLAVLSIGINIMEKDPSLTFSYVLHDSGFTSMRAAEKWVKAITKSKV